jgi:hypothetical protein
MLNELLFGIRDSSFVNFSLLGDLIGLKDSILFIFED